MASGTSAAAKGKARLQDAPEDYLGAFMNGSVTAKKVASLNVGLRTYELSCV